MTARTARQLAVIVVGITAMLAVMLLAFVTPSVNSGAHDLPLAVSGPEAAVSQLRAGLDEARPGAFDVTVYDSADQAREAILDREAIGGLTVGDDGLTVLTASAAGTPYPSLLQGVGAALAASGQQVGYDEVAPLSADDPTGAGLGALGLPMVFGGMATAVLLSTRFKGSPAPRVVGAVSIAVLGGFLVTAILQFGFGTLDGNYGLTALSLVLGIAAMALFVLGMESILGFAGLGVAGLTMLLVANPLSGLATGPQWLPHPWGAVGQLLPVGAAGTAIRSMAFFDGGGATPALLVLGAWIVVGLVLCFVPKPWRALPGS
ncbi:hypothetical protein [Nocardioides sp.]|uniref:hypothetical protein n=1 Tax=Nocardioides sp. TaxID=35761 RepID=UPI0039E60992